MHTLITFSEVATKLSFCSWFWLKYEKKTLVAGFRFATEKEGG